MNSKHKIPLLVGDLVKHTVEGETSVVNNVVNLAKSPFMAKQLDELHVMVDAIVKSRLPNLLDCALDKSLGEGRIEDISGNGDGLTTSSIDISGNLISLT